MVRDLLQWKFHCSHLQSSGTVRPESQSKGGPPLKRGRSGGGAAKNLWFLYRFRKGAVGATPRLPNACLEAPCSSLKLVHPSSTLPKRLIFLWVFNVFAFGRTSIRRCPNRAEPYNILPLGCCWAGHLPLKLWRESKVALEPTETLAVIQSGS